MNEELEIRKHIPISYDDYTTHVITFSQPITGDINTVMGHTQVILFIGDNMHYLSFTPDIYTVRLRVYTNNGPFLTF